MYTVLKQSLCREQHHLVEDGGQRSHGGVPAAVLLEGVLVQNGQGDHFGQNDGYSGPDFSIHRD